MDLMNQNALPSRLESRLLFAVPKSAPPSALQTTLQTLTNSITEGRLQQATLDLLAGSDIQFRRDHRLDIALVKNHPIALVFLPAADIPTFVGEGRVDLGITGQDQIFEHEATTPPEEETWAEEVLDLAFGYCRLQVQVPEKGAYAHPRDLIGRHICTSFVGLTKRYFARLEAQEKGVTNGDLSDNGTQLKTKIKHLSGSVEAACALGVADGIVDLVESGDTMKAAGLEAIDTVVESRAVLIKSKHPSNPKLVDMVASRIRGVIAAQQFVLCQYNIPRHLIPTATKITPGKRAPTITALDNADWLAVSSMVEKKRIATVMDELSDCGATDILVLDIANSR